MTLSNFRQTLSEIIYPEQLRIRDEAERRANRDALTGLANRRALDAALPAAEADPAWSIVAFDLNNFGVVNKLRGHCAGDWLLCEMAAALRTVAHAYDCSERVFRRGGDEFVIIAPVEHACAIRSSVEQLFGEHLIVSLPAGYKRTVRVSVSGTYGQCFAEADLLLHARKQSAKGAVS